MTTWTATAGSIVCVLCVLQACGDHPSPPDRTGRIPVIPTFGVPEEVDGGEAAGNCVLTGTWILAYTPAMGDCNASSDTVEISPDDAGSYVAEFLTEPPIDNCGVANDHPAEPEVTSKVELETCVMELSWTATWCTGGQNRCDTRSITLSPSAAGLSSTMLRSVCWECNNLPDPIMLKYDISATRAP